MLPLNALSRSMRVACTVVALLSVPSTSTKSPLVGPPLGRSESVVVLFQFTRIVPSMKELVPATPLTVPFSSTAGVAPATPFFSR